MCKDSPAVTESHSHVHLGHKVLQKNDQLAHQNEHFFEDHHIACFNILSSPGSGKTTLLETLLQRLNNRYKFAVIEGDQQTFLDAARIRKHTSNVIQINTDKGCHLDAHMVHHALEKLDLDGVDFLLIENVGNLICPSMFNLGEAKKIVVLSVTEGDDKPLKYPNAFYEADLAIITKADLLPYVDFNVEKCQDYIRRINPNIPIMIISCKNGFGLEQLDSWFENEKQQLCMNVGN